MTKIVQFFAGPGAGKSTIAARVFGELKRRGVETERADEYAKELLFDGRDIILRENQILVMANQWERIRRLIGKTDIIICDSPVFLSSIYAPSHYPKEFHQMLKWCHDQVESINFLLQRRPETFKTQGRIHSEAISKVIDTSVYNLLVENNIPYIELPAIGSAGHALAYLESINLIPVRKNQEKEQFENTTKDP